MNIVPIPESNSSESNQNEVTNRADRFRDYGFFNPYTRGSRRSLGINDASMNETENQDRLNRAREIADSAGRNYTVWHEDGTSTYIAPTFTTNEATAIWYYSSPGGSTITTSPTFQNYTQMTQQDKAKQEIEFMEKMLNTFLRTYEENFMSVNPDLELKYEFTITNHEVTHPVDTLLTKHVAYARLEKMVRPKAPDTILDKTKWEEETQWEKLLIYNQAYKFQDVSERVDPAMKWKKELLQDCLRRLVTGGLEYAELLKKMQLMTKNKEGQSVAEVTGAAGEEKIIITDKMPEPLRQDEKEYLAWVKKNHEPEK